MATPLKSTEFGSAQLQRVKYTHDAMIDLVLEKPEISQNEIAKHFGFTTAWISRVFCSDSFQARLAERKTELIDPGIIASIENRLQGLAMTSMEVLERKLTMSPNDSETALEVLKITTKSLGYGAKDRNVNVQQNFVVALPTQATSAADWASANGGTVLDAEIVVPK